MKYGMFQPNFMEKSRSDPLKPNSSYWFAEEGQMGLQPKKDYSYSSSGWENRINPTAMIPFCYYNQEWLGEYRGYPEHELDDVRGINRTFLEEI